VSVKNHDIRFKNALGLTKDPFSPEPDPLFYFSFDSFEQRLKMLRGLVQGADILVLVIGEPGSGKTTLLNRLLAATTAQWKSVRVQTDPDSAAPRTTDTLEHEGYPAYVLGDAKNPVVIVDDCDKLPPRELEFLLQNAMVPGSSHKIKRLVLFGSSDLYTRVTRMVEKLSAQTAVNKINLPGMTAKQTGVYLQHRLAAAGYAGNNPFNDSAVKDIHQSSGGYPGPVNDIAQQWLNKKYSTKKEGRRMLQHFSAPPRRMAVWMVAGTIIILAAVLWLFQNRKPPGTAPPNQKIAKKVFRQKIPQDQQLAEKIIRQKITGDKTPAQAPKELQRQPPANVKAASVPSTEIENRQEALKEEASLVPATGAMPESNQTEQKIETPAAAGPPPDAAPPVFSKKPEPAGPFTGAATEKSKPQEISETPIAAAPITQLPEAVAQRPKEDERSVHRENWLLSQDPAYFTIQIMGVHDEELLLEFIEKNHLLQQNKIAYYESTFEDKQWYQLLYGIYPTRPDAESAVAKLPENIRRAGPWIRRLSTIQMVIRERELQ
jgi:DamX protein